MNTAKNLGIYMDHSNAHIIEFTVEPMSTQTITSEFTHQEKEESLNKSERLMHNKEQHEQAAYYKSLAAVIINYTHVLLFGPTNAKTELHNILKEDHRYAAIKIDIEPTDKMSENEQHVFVRKHFSKH